MFDGPGGLFTGPRLQHRLTAGGVGDVAGYLERATRFGRIVATRLWAARPEQLLHTFFVDGDVDVVIPWHGDRVLLDAPGDRQRRAPNWEGRDAESAQQLQRHTEGTAKTVRAHPVSCAAANLQLSKAATGFEKPDYPGVGVADGVAAHARCVLNAPFNACALNAAPVPHDLMSRSSSTSGAGAGYVVVLAPVQLWVVLHADHAV